MAMDEKEMKRALDAVCASEPKSSKGIRPWQTWRVQSTNPLETNNQDAQLGETKAPPTPQLKDSQ
jgi:hypothetical protein